MTDLERSILKRLQKIYPRHASPEDFGDLCQDRQFLLVTFFKLYEMGLIDAFFRKSPVDGTVLDAAVIKLTGKGLASFEPQPLPSVNIGEIKPTYNITATDQSSVNASINVAGKDITSKQEPNWKDFLDLLISNIETSSLPKEQKTGIIAKLKSAFKAEIAPVLAQIIIQTVKQFLHL